MAPFDVNLAHQAFALRHVFPDSVVHLRRGRLVWKGSLVPTDASGTYEVDLIANSPRSTPQVWVREPSLRPSDDGRLPHIHKGGNLCLNTIGQWSSRMLFVDSVIPWTSEWLMYYELWRATDVWFGDGAEKLDQVSQDLLLHPVPDTDWQETRQSCAGPERSGRMYKDGLMSGAQ